MNGFAPIGLGLSPGDGYGDTPRVAGEKLNQMLAELFARMDSVNQTVAALAEAIENGTPGPTPTPTPSPTVTLSAAQSKAEGNSGTTVFTYTVTRSSSIGAISVPWSFAPGGTSANDFAGSAYPAGGSVAIANGAATGTFSVTVAGDITVETNESFTVSISAPNGYVSGGSLSATGTILNDDILPSFTTQPTVVTAGPYLVGNVVAFDPGVIANGLLGAVYPRLGANQGDALSSSSFELTAPGQLVFRVYDSTGAVYADTAAITVAAAVVGAAVPPVLSSADGYVAGTNPPRVKVAIDETTEKPLYKLRLRADRKASGVFEPVPGLTVEILDLMAFFESEDATVDAWAGLAAGPFRLYADFLPLGSEGAASGNSNLWQQTLAAVSLPPATTVWDDANRSQYVSLLGNTEPNNRKATAQNTNGATGILSTTFRTDERYFEITVSDTSGIRVGTAATTDVMGPFTDPTGNWVGAFGAAAPNTTFGVRITPKVGATNGTITVTTAADGAVVGTVSNPLTAYKIYLAIYNSTVVTLNTGQVAFVATPPVTRWN